MLLRQRQPAFAAALSSAEQYVSCPADPLLVLGWPGRRQETSGRAAEWREQAEGARPCDSVGTAVRSELGDQVADMSADRVH